MEQFTQITKKYFCDTLCRVPSILMGSGKAGENYLGDRRSEIIEACKRVDANNADIRMGIQRSKFVLFTDKHGHRSRLDFDQINTVYSFFSLSDILVCKMYHKELNEYRYIIYKII